MNNKKKTVFDAILEHQQVPVILVALLCVVGVFSFIKIPKQEFPNFTVLEGLVVAVFPGASSEQVDARVAKPLQDYLFSYREVDRVHTYSVSKEGQCVVFLYINSGVNEGEFWPKLQIGLQEFKSQLPSQTLALTAVSDFGDYSTILLSISSDNRTYRELESYCNRLSGMIRVYDEVSSIQTFGLQKEEVSVYIDARQLAFYGIDPAVISADIQLSSIAGYGSAINGGDLKMPIRLPGEYKTEADLAEQIIFTTPQGRIIRLKDVADIKREYVVDTSFVECNGKRAVGLSISMSIGNNVIDFGKHIDKIIDSFKENIPADVEIIKVADQPSVVNTSITHFFRDFVIAIVAVIIVMVLFLPRRIAAVAAITIPIVVLIDMTLLNFLGVQLDTVSLAALTMALGIIVDDPVVVIDNYVEKLDEGLSLREAATGSVRELFFPVLTATLAIVAAFLPTNLYLTGMNKDFIKPAPISVAIALPVSFFVAMFFVPILNIRFIKSGLLTLKKNKAGKKTTLERAQDFYNNVYLASAMRHPNRAIMIGVFCVAAGFALLVVTPRQPFPKLEHSNFAVELYFPEGTSLAANQKTTKEVADLIRGDERVKNVVSFFGSSSPRFSVLYAPQIPALNYSQLIVNTYTNKQTEDIIKEYSAKYAGEWPEAHVRWKQLDFLPNDAPIEVQISGGDIPSIKKFADEVKKILAEEEDIIWIKDDYRNPLLAIDVNMNDEAANRLGITKGSLALSAALAYSKIPVATIWEDDYAKTVYLKRDYRAEDGAAAEDVLDLYVITPEKTAPVMLREIAGITPGFTEGQIVRRNGKYTIMVSGDVAYGKLASDIFARVSKKTNKLSRPDNMSIYYAGQHELEMNIFIPFGFSLATSVVIIFILLLFQFKNVRCTLLVMSSMPLALIGAVAGLLIIGYPFGTTSFMGLIGLLGIVTRNGIVFVSYANELREKGMSAKEAAVAAGERRMRPIFLTASAAAAGVIPLIMSGSLLWGPMGSVICFGLIGSTLLTLYVLPAAYWKFSGENNPPSESQNAKEVSGE